MLALPRCRLKPWKSPARKAPGPSKSKTLAIIAGALALTLAVIVFVRWPTAKEASETYLDIQANPGAQVVIDDRVAGTAGSDGAFSAKVSPGTHRVQARLEGYAPRTETVTVKAGSRLPVDAVLNTIVAVAAPPALAEASPPAPTPSGTLLVRSNVPGADVLIDGNLKGVTGQDRRFETALPQGTYRLQAKKHGYDDAPEQRIEISARKEKQLSLSLRPSPPNAMEAPATEAPKKTNPDVDNLVSAGKQEYENGKYDSAIASYQKALQADPRNAAAQAGLDKAKRAKQVEEQMTEAHGVGQPSQFPPPPMITLFQEIPKSIHQGDKVTIAWATQNATEISINYDKVASNGSKEVQPNQSTDFTLTATGPGGTKKETIHVDVQPKATEPQHPVPTSTAGPSDEEGISQARDRWQKRYEQEEHATFLEDNCPPLQPIKSDGVDWTCQPKITYVVRETKRTLTPSVTYHFKKKDGKWYIEGRPVFSNALQSP